MCRMLAERLLVGLGLLVASAAGVVVDVVRVGLVVLAERRLPGCNLLS